MVELMASSIWGCFEKTAQSNPQGVALVYLGETISFQDLKERALRMASSFARLGIGPQERVLIYLYNIPQTIISLLALQRLGAIPVPVAPVYGSYDLKYLANDSGAQSVICMDTNFNYVSEIIPQTSIKQVIVTNMVDLIPVWKRLIAKGFDRVPSGKSPSGKGIYSFVDLLKRGSASQLPEWIEPGPTDTALLLYTGGTTGFPKGVPLPGGLFLHNCLEWRRASEDLVPVGKAVTALAAPLYHIIGQMDAMTPLLVGGEPLLMFPRVVIDALMDHIQRYRATNMFAVPTLYRMILEHDRVDFYNMSSLKYCGTGGDVLPAEVARRWQKKFGVPLYQGYGTTEFCGAISLSYARDGIPPQGAAGKVIPGAEVMLMDPETLKAVGEGEPGELLGTSRYPVRGYWNKPEETKKCFLDIDGRLWYRTRDIMRIDKDGWLYFLDRSVDMIKHKGYR
ncbi:MAG TPA: long-chain fatty acid--CoA ligase, partial [Desulfobacterales bacterium]|nr:long-chain fatty acid--CoA ligase [Desulfobacterales bacterium]